MKIEKLFIPATSFSNGLADINMERLSDVVVIAGKNGSGKSRLLEKIYFAVNGYISTTQREIQERDFNQYVYNTQRNQAAHDPHYLSGLKREAYPPVDENLVFDAEYERYKAVYFVPNCFKFVDPADLTPNSLSEHYDKCKNIGVESTEESTFAYIQEVFTRYFRATHPDFDSDMNEKNNAKKAFNELDELIEKFIGTNIKSQINENDVTLFGIPIGRSGLSNGQMVLLELCVALHAQKTSLNNVILLLDEPENHLHPKALLQFIDSIQSALKDGQIWIATHSIHVMSNVDTKDIWYMEGGKVEYSGRTPERVLSSLLGGEDGIRHLYNFIGLPAEFAANQFAYECLFPPTVCDTNIHDKQTNQICNSIRGDPNFGNPLRIFDFGAGKGRLADAISAISCDFKQPVSNLVDYRAYDLSIEHKETCVNAIGKMYDDVHKRYFNNETSIRNQIDKKSCDIIVMCNVLHEIDPVGWVPLFKQDGIISYLLKDNGHLLIVEDSIIPVGEAPHKNGFFVLQSGEIKTLFGIPKESSELVITDADGRGRLIAYSIPKKFIANVNRDLVKETIESLQRTAKSNIDRLREKTDYKSGRELGFWTQQLANCVLLLEKF